MSITAVTLTEVKLILFMHVGWFFNRFVYTHDKYLPRSEMTVCVTSDMGPVGPVVLKLNANLGEMSLISIQIV